MTVHSSVVRKYSRAVTPQEFRAMLKTLVPELPDGAAVEADVIPFNDSGAVMPGLSGPRLDINRCGIMLKWSTEEDG